MARQVSDDAAGADSLSLGDEGRSPRTHAIQSNADTSQVSGSANAFPIADLACDHVCPRIYLSRVAHLKAKMVSSFSLTLKSRNWGAETPY